ncbi:Orc1-type DNA replication protein [Haloferax gibbonsii ATCC 33959]|uniref:Orc1-type DNA replication protein n=1 Tax=Haloferax gibbonsii (strain ATCC 33959 / DSM 4427 / JCM 8863 / NBRC 102184 / NCIMB 2188 / Ma 2.38) TaxID=1227459 RepID=M0H8U0_HALGM|nr:AAA family ATPase [Haloferax gibbonsii]ELZ80152.1 Orc1-type DNA replication protein [Haloferax gibbonsii ATCC 33959]
MFDRNKKDNGILRSETYLTADHQPDKPIEREYELRRIADAVRPLTHRKTGENLLIHGPSGVGKSTLVQHVFGQLEQETRVKPVYINCWQYNTRPSLLTELLIQLGYPAPRKGKPVDELLSKIREWLDKNYSVAIALDEFDQLKDGTEVIYDLQLLNEQAAHKIGIIMVSNQHPSQIHLDPRSQSRLSCQTLQYKPYNQNQLENILQKRVEQAFRPGSVSQEVIEQIARNVAETSGDCRQALHTLLQAGRKADREGDLKLNNQHIQ